MKENIKIALFEFIDLTESEWLVFSESFIVKHYNKGEYLLKADDLCDYVGFVDKGFFTFFYLIEGVQHIRGFFFPNEFISNYSCFLLENKSKFNIQALEDSSVTLIHRDALFRSYKKLPKVQELSRNIVENLYIEVSEKYESFFLKTAEERYLELINSRPTIIQRIPQYMIASYLGITPEGLSRIRKRLAKK
ncbi:Crp/Fnr family transcriptional regulator [Formosa sp. Hel1_33_131]|uniref:Crp/Fnr family transcriptional regulator n=1 Tax=Formosa sp. Hel1_33_131 TaxID=1336794 RepID=UPI00084E2DF9|nr:Crp/Fnr family transcriptional regulator [Formosa sp. Hel1_33_131]